MDKSKLNSLVKYAESLRNKLESTTPAKHLGRVGAYKQYLLRELEAVTKKIEAAKLMATK